MTKYSAITRALLVFALLFFTTTYVSAGGWGHGPSLSQTHRFVPEPPKLPGHWGNGPNIAGWHPFHTLIPAKPLDGAKQAWVAVGNGATVVYQVCVRKDFR
jgi:hypothetical protein